MKENIDKEATKLINSVLFKLNFVVMLISFITFRTGLYIFNKIIGKE